MAPGYAKLPQVQASRPLVNRYFGSKEQPFAEAVVAVNSTPTIATDAVLGQLSRVAPSPGR